LIAPAVWGNKQRDDPTAWTLVQAAITPKGLGTGKGVGKMKGTSAATVGEFVSAGIAAILFWFLYAQLDTNTIRVLAFLGVWCLLAILLMAVYRSFSLPERQKAPNRVSAWRIRFGR
jgi:uncharacterized membrane protein